MSEGSDTPLGGALIELWAFVDHAPTFVATVIADDAGRFSLEPPRASERSAPGHGYELRVVSPRGDLLHVEHHVLDEESFDHQVLLRVEGAARAPSREPALEAAFPELVSMPSALDRGLVLQDDDGVSGAGPLVHDGGSTPVERALSHAGLPTDAEGLIDISAEELRGALRSGVEEGVVTAELLPELDQLVESLCREAVERAIEAGPSRLAPSRGAVLASLDLPPERLRDVLGAYQARSRQGSLEQNWAEVDENADDAVAGDVAACLAVAEVVGDDPRLVRRLHQARRQGSWAAVEDLTELEFEDWCDLVEDCYREDLEAEGADLESAYRAHVEARAASILDQFEASYPSPYIRRELLARDVVGAGARHVLERAAEHDFTSDSIRERVIRDADVSRGLGPEDIEQAVSEIEGVERLSRLDCRAEEVATLVASGLDSAQSIAALNRRGFVETYAESLGGRAQAARVHAQAQIAASANQVAAIGLAQARQPGPFVLGGAVPDELKNVPRFRQLFGVDALCECVHCGSVYSPAAYFVDLMRYLGDTDRLVRSLDRIAPALRSKASERLKYKPLDLLLARRPDLADIPLTCENTLTPLPYIDLVNEILEARVSGKPWNPDTGKTPADVLRAIPQNTNREAYEVLRDAVFPVGLPYHEALETFRAYVAHLGVPRLTLLTTFARTRPAAIDVTAESLGMSREEFGLVADPLRELWRHWGFAAATADEELIAKLAPAPSLMKASGLSFAELVELSSSRFLSRESRWTLVTPAVDCDPARVRIEGLTAASLARALKLVRLKRRLGWSFTELDRMLSALGARELDATLLERIVAARDLSRELRLSPTELLVLWAPLDTFGKDSPFSRLLETRVVAWQLGDDQFRLRPDRSELFATGDDLTPIAPALLAAFRVTHDELAAVIRSNERRGQRPKLDLAGLSAVHRSVLLARATGLAVRQLDALLRLAPADSDPFSPGDPLATLRFVRLVKEIQDSPFSPEQVLYLFLHEAEPRFDPTPKPAQVQSALSSVRRGLVDAFAETAHPTEIAADTLRQKLALLLDATLLDAAVEVLDPRSRLADATRREFFDRHLARLFPDPSAAVLRLFGPGAPDATPEARARSNAAFVLEHLLPSLRMRQLRGAIVQVVSDSIGLSSASTGRLLEHALRSRRDPQKPLIADFAALLGTGLSGAYFDNPDLSGAPKATRVDAEIAFSWAGAPPAEGVPGERFSARYTGRIHPKADAEHTFYVSSDGSVRLSLVIDGEERVLIERAAVAAAAAEQSSTRIRLDSGKLYELRLEYRNQGGPASLTLSYGTSPASKQVVPSTHLYPSDGLTSFAPVEESYRRIHKAALLLTGFGATDAHLAWLSGETRPLDLDALPMTAGDEALGKALFARFRQLAALYAFRKGLAPSSVDVFEMFRAKDAAEALARLLQATGWDAAAVGEILGADGLSASVRGAGPPAEQSLLLRLARAMDVQRRLGVSASTLFAWASGAPDTRMAAEAVQAVKARYDERRWLEVARSLNDPLRLARRDALVAYLLPRLAEKGVLNRNQLFEYFLIDVDMNPCMLTSRLRQAIGSVQTYYQRCLMSLELTHPRLIDESAWRWMKNYRVWEANRKNFLYPENWIEPELRDDKSPLFSAFERAILQDEIKRENVEAAFIDYVQGLDEIARLDVRATCFEPETGRARSARRSGADAHWASGTHHVFGRTFGAPHVWYHRRLEAGLWTAWEKIEADIDGEHLVPVIFHGRLHLFWAVFREVSKKPPARKQDAKGPLLELGKDWEIHLAYSVYDRGRWARKRASNGGIVDRLDMYRTDTVDRKKEVVALAGSTTFPASAYRLTVRSASASELRIQLWRRKLEPTKLALEPVTVESIGEFTLEGCNGELRRDRAERSAWVLPHVASQHLAIAPKTSFATRRLPAPSGSAVDGQGFSLMTSGGATALMLPAGNANGHAPLLSRVQSPEARVLFGDDGGVAPFFFQTTQQCFFAHPAGGAVARKVVHFGRFLHFGKPLGKAKAEPQRTRRTREVSEAAAESEAAPSRGGIAEPWLQPGAAADVDVEALEPSERDRWEDEQDEAWHPEDAEARRAPRPRRPGTSRRARAVAARRPVVSRPSMQVTTRTVLDQKMRFVAFQHPKSCELLIALKSEGLDGLFADGAHKARDATAGFLKHAPTGLVDGPHPRDDLDFDLSSPYGVYNWELFFHAPLLVALRLAKEGRHEEAQRWFHFIFDPTVDDSDASAKRFWRFLPLKLEKDEGAQQVVKSLSTATPATSPEARNIQAQLMAWLEKPFSPHVIARLRLAAYQKAVVMKYIDNLIEWGDRLFRQDTMESIQEATQLYILAGNIMGPKPERIDRIVETPATTFRAIRDATNLFANWMVHFETAQVRRPFQIAVRPAHQGVTQALRLETEYFCVPPNPQLDKYWDTVGDRLHKIRNCMNIQGVVRQLPLFEPPFDPGMLVRAAAGGADLSSVVSGLNAPPPHQRFSFVIRRALALAEELRSFGALALKTLERRDAEALAALRAGSESKLQRAMRDVRKLHVKQVEEELSELALRREEVELKIQHLTAQTQELMNPQERAGQTAMTLSKVYTIVTEGIELASKIAYAIPEIQSGGAGISSPFVTLQLGGQMFGSISSAVASTVQKVADRSELEAELAQTQAEYQRRRAEWQQELEVLGKERAQLDKHVAGVNLKLEIANKELRRYDVELENSEQMQEFLRSKFTGEQLYGWMLSQLATVHFQVYKFAFDAARQAERAFQFERSETTASFIEFAYWDSLKRGLFAGERLLLDLRRLESAYLEGDRRALEITRHLSLRDDFPLAYDELLASGRCDFEVSEALLDADFPGHYFRRIKSLSISVVAALKPLSNVNSTLTLLSSRLRSDPGAGGNYGSAEDMDDARFSNNPVQVQTIATSQPSSDAGLFQLKLDDPRYLPFEGAGAISKWRLKLAQADNALDLLQLEDVVLSLAYTARDGGAPLEAAARAHRLRALGQGTLRPAPSHRVSLRREQPEIHRQLAALAPGQELEAKLNVTAERLPGRLRDFEVRIERAHAVVHPRARAVLPVDALRLRLEPPRGTATPVSGLSAPWPGSKALRGSAEASGPLGEWKLSLGLAPSVSGALIDDVVIHFELRVRS